MEWFERPLYRWGSYIVFTVVAFVLALLITFPDGQVKRIVAVQIEHQLEKNMKKSYVVSVSDLDPWWFGVELEGLTIELQSVAEEQSGTESPPTKGGGDETAAGPKARGKSKKKKGMAPAEGPETKIEIPSLGARFSPLGSILNAGLSVRYHLGLGGGVIGGTYTRASGAQYLSIAIDSLQLDNTPALEQLSGIPMFGRLDGHGEFTMAVKRPVVTDGSFELRGKKVTLGPKPKLKVEALPVGHISVPQVNFGNLETRLHVEKKEGNRPTVVLDKFDSQGRDLRLQIWGTVDLARRLGQADTKLKGRIQFDPEFAQKNQPIRALQRHQKFQNGQSGDWYGLVFWGKLNNLQWKGSPTAAKGPSADKGNAGDGQKAPPAGKGG